ncbi:7-alpha-hydroxysteroid dehydrogenase [Aspergillus heteromorphus CBS 117.55]|uniref:7-alpha-hydroxysteroid dehydrogenase n=1 Tax=Aspergillus heteromorphus CBS 117.55 TaxID=1448321 RepID=A0A317VC20_9EURO|nr:7-alpha-hydroxysteroid dehydrogenase [Aspergillus heteromorphus CBS 117.55]PWY70502.1 7-alpha-hydroxysteroid dehydrogenase [Aspergillus heteromorphus CBS 117.55]
MNPLETPNLMNVKGRVALVTGGSSGIGRMIAQGLVSNGAKVYIVALPSDPIAETVAELNAAGPGSAEGYPCDLTSKSSIAALAQTITTLEPHLDILISNAGIRRDPPIACNVLTASLPDLQASLWSSPESDWAETFQVNTTAHYFLTVALLPLLVAAANQPLDNGQLGRDDGRGVVLLTSSCASMHNASNVDMMSYATSKAATDHLVRLLAVKVARFGVRVLGINPGFFPSRMNPMGGKGDIFKGLVEKVPAGRAGRAEDIVGVVVFLVSKAGVSGVSWFFNDG